MIRIIIFLLIHIYFIYDLHLIGGILFRPNSQGRMIFSPESILEIIKAPLKIKEFWSTELIKSNYYFLLLIGLILSLIYSKCFIKLSS